MATKHGTDQNTPLLSKEQLERKKLEAEIWEIRRPIWQHSAFWTNIATIAITLAGGVIAWYTGWFDVRKLEIRNENTLLQAQNERLSAQKDTLTSETAKLDATRIVLNADLQKLSEQRSEQQHNLVITTNELAQLQRQLTEKQQLVENLSAKLSEINKENDQAKALVTKITDFQSQRDAAELRLTQARSRLARSYELSRMVMSSSQDYIQATSEAHKDASKMGDMATAGALWAVNIGKWRESYDTDHKAFSLQEFEATNSIPMINSADFKK